MRNLKNLNFIFTYNSLHWNVQSVISGSSDFSGLIRHSWLQIHWLNFVHFLSETEKNSFDYKHLVYQSLDFKYQKNQGEEWEEGGDWVAFYQVCCKPLPVFSSLLNHNINQDVSHFIRKHIFYKMTLIKLSSITRSSNTGTYTFWKI